MLQLDGIQPGDGVKVHLVTTACKHCMVVQDLQTLKQEVYTYVIVPHYIACYCTKPLNIKYSLK